jgi:hypothetical protein
MTVFFSSLVLAKKLILFSAMSGTPDQNKGGGLKVLASTESPVKG